MATTPSDQDARAIDRVLQQPRVLPPGPAEPRAARSRSRSALTTLPVATAAAGAARGSFLEVHPRQPKPSECTSVRTPYAGTSRGSVVWTDWDFWSRLLRRSRIGSALAGHFSKSHRPLVREVCRSCS